MKQSQVTETQSVYTFGKKNFRILTISDLRTGMIVTSTINQPASDQKNANFNSALGAPFWNQMVIRGNESNTEPHGVSIGRPYAMISDAVPGTLVVGYEPINYAADSDQTFLLIADQNDNLPSLTDTSLFDAA